MRVLVTGGAGFIGSHIVDKLVDAGHRVIVVDNMSTGEEINLNPDAIFYRVDIRDVEQLERVFSSEKPDIVNHQAAHIDLRKSLSDPRYDAEINILGTLNVLNLALVYKVEKVIFASTAAVYSKADFLPVDEEHAIKPMSAYGVSKLTCEWYIRLFADIHGLRYTVFRYGNVYGPRQSAKTGVVAVFTERIIDGGKPVIFGDGSKSRDYVYVDDIASANLMAVQSRGDRETFNLSWGKEISDYNVFIAVRDALNAEVEPLFEKKRPGELDRIALDNSKARRLLGWMPQIHFRKGVEKTVKYYQTMVADSSRHTANFGK